MQCPHCSASLDDGSWSCPRCGNPVQPRNHDVSLAFVGNGVELLGWMLVMLLAMVALLAPGAWALAAICRWFCRNLRWSDGETAEFHGEGGQIVGWWLLSLLSGSFPTRELHRVTGVPVLVSISVVRLDSTNSGIAVVLFLLGCLGLLHVIRWFVANVRLRSGTTFAFHGGYWELAGWYVLNAVLTLTIIGWAWSTAAMYRWMARNTRSDDRALRFHGEGHQVLWRVIVTVLMCLPVLTIPWAVLWYTRWVVANVTVEGQVGDLAVD
jgi:uncharacterized membrane protein YjgN (DUF898 family)